MVQKTQIIYKPSDITHVLEKVHKDPDYARARSKVVQIYVSRFLAGEIKDMLKTIRESCPDFEISGYSLYGNGPLNSKKFVKLSFCYFFESDVRSVECELICDHESRAIEKIRSELGKTPDIKGVQVIANSYEMNFTRILEEISRGYEDVVFFGGIANVNVMDSLNNGDGGMTLSEYRDLADKICEKIDSDNESWMDCVVPYIVGKTLIKRGMILLIYSGENLHFHAKSVLGWKPIGKCMAASVTESEKDGLVRVKEIGGMKASEVYEHYLGVKQNSFFVDNVCEFPLMLERSGYAIARVPMGFDQDGTLLFFGSIKDGEKLRFSYGNKEEMLHETALASVDMYEFCPQGLILTICADRPMFLKEDAPKEVEFFKEVNPNLIHGHGGCEILRYKGKGGVLNCVLAAVGMREGPRPSCCGSCTVKIPEYKINQNNIPLEGRFATFLEVMTGELAEMAIKAKAANKAKSAFLSNMSHEIRTPINAILGMDEMILRESSDPSTLEYAENIRTAGTSLLGLVNDILDFSKIEAGKMDIIPVDYEFASLLNDLVNMIQKRADDKGLSLTVDIDTNIPHLLYGDEIRVKQAVTNILTNAVKYTKEGGVTLRVKYLGTDGENVDLRFSVIDTGIGIKKEDIGKLYSAFERIEERRNRTIEGTGLGMNITRQLLSLMGSELEVESEYGKGSEFSFNIRQKVVKWEPIGDFNEALKRYTEGRSKYKERFVAPEAQVLVVDDTQMNLTVIRGLLKQTKVQIDTAVSGAECLEKVRKKRYDLIFLDHRMPGMDGIETLAAMREMKDNKSEGVPVISLTANAVSGAREEYIKAGFNDYITKPIDPAKLEEMMAAYLPKEKLICSGEASGNADEKANKLDSDRNDEVKPLSSLEKIEGLDVKQGIMHCGSEEGLLEAVEVYAESAAENAAEIGAYYKDRNWKDYTVKVHALKSMSRVIGAAELGEMAAGLEAAGDRGDEAKIDAETEELLNKYESLVRDISTVLGLNGKGESDSEANEFLPMISEGELSDAYEAIKEIASSYDYDSIVMVMDSLAGYRIPDTEKKKISELKAAIAKPDWEMIQRIAG
ncbi:MAG: response regulator [Lachnospiraceae bacterium]|nr:response regulator [Lachnospiraceae bacterium]